VNIDDAISADEAAEIMGVSRAWVAKMVTEGTLTGFRIHSRAIVVSKRAAVENALAYAAKRGKKVRGRPRSKAS
jgi:excisionase family DNA binding protein